MLGDLIANLDRPDVASTVLASLEPDVIARIEQRAAAAAMIAPDFIAAPFASLWSGPMMSFGSNSSPSCARRKIQASSQSRRFLGG